MIITCNVNPKYSLLLSHDGNITEYYFNSIIPYDSKAFKNSNLLVVYDTLKCENAAICEKVSKCEKIFNAKCEN